MRRLAQDGIQYRRPPCSSGCQQAAVPAGEGRAA